MKLLLDTQSLLWWFSDDLRLGARARSLIGDPRGSVLVSVASFWEISIKRRIGKLDDFGSVLMREARESDFSIIGIEPRHLAMLEELDARPGHRDPFDHLILVHAMAEGAILVTSDRQLQSYPVRVLGPA